MFKGWKLYQRFAQFIQFLWILVLVARCLPALYFLHRYFLLPDTGELENPPYEIASEIIAKDGETLGKGI